MFSFFYCKKILLSLHTSPVNLTIFFACCLLPWLQSPSVWHHSTVLFPLNAEKSIISMGGDSLNCIFLNTDFPPSLLFWESTSFHQKQKQSPHCCVALCVDQYYYWVFPVDWNVFDLLINVCHLFPWPSFPPAYLLRIEVDLITFCKVDLIQFKIAASLLRISVTPSGKKHKHNRTPPSKVLASQRNQAWKQMNQ